jgi:hypothetical protein
LSIINEQFQYQYNFLLTIDIQAISTQSVAALTEEARRGNDKSQ